MTTSGSGSPPEIGCGRGADATEIARLAALDPVDYDRAPEPAADALGVRLGTLDGLVRAARPKLEETVGGRAVALPEAEPWPEPVDGAAVLSELSAALRRHLVLGPAAVDCCALWIMHTWVYERFEHTPRLAVRSPAPRCGKTTLIDVLALTTRRPMTADNISASAVFRAVEAMRPLTLLVDEADAFLREKEELRGVLNSGFKASGQVVRTVEVDGVLQPVAFATFCPVGLAGIRELPATLEDRAVPVDLARKTASEKVVRLRARGARAALRELASKLARWSADRGPLLTPDPPVPEAMGDREGDISVPLLSVADDAGGEWPGRARRALLEVFGKRSALEAAADTGTLLLADIRGLFLAASALRMTSADLVAGLGEMEERPWAEWKHGKPMTRPQLAAELKPFGITPRTIRTIVGTGTKKGYHRDAFEEVWARYLPSADVPSSSNGGKEASHRHNRAASGASREIGAVTPGPVLRPDDRAKAANDRACDGVTAPDPPWRRNGRADGSSGDL